LRNRSYIGAPNNVKPLAAPITYYHQLFLFERTTPAVWFCQTQLQINPNDLLVILGCLKANRPKISRACQQVLANHGQ
jgi:hypothetical protein